MLVLVWLASLFYLSGSELFFFSASNCYKSDMYGIFLLLVIFCWLTLFWQSVPHVSRIRVVNFQFLKRFNY